MEIDLIINSGNELIRVIVLKVLKDGIENIYYYPVGNINIDLPNLDSANFNLMTKEIPSNVIVISNF